MYLAVASMKPNKEMQLVRHRVLRMVLTLSRMIECQFKNILLKSFTYRHGKKDINPYNIGTIEMGSL